MNRSTFFKTLGLGIASAPVVAAASIKPRLGTRFAKIEALPDDAGRVISLIQYDKRIFVACENGVYYFNPEGSK